MGLLFFFRNPYEVTSHALIIGFVFILNFLNDQLRMLHILILAVAKVKTRSNPTRIASYLTSLLEAGKPSRIAYSSCSLVGDCKIRPILEPEALDAPST